MSAQHEIHYPSNLKIMKVVLSFHGNKHYQILFLPQGTYVPNIGFVCYQQQTYEDIWIQGFHSYKLHNLFLLL